MTVLELQFLDDEDGIDRWLIDGELVERRHGYHSPSHASTLVNICAMLHIWSKQSGSNAKVYGYGCPYVLKRDPDTLLSYDASIAESHPSDGEFIERPPLLAVEIRELEESEDLVNKLVASSLRLGVAEMWVIDPIEKSVAIHLADSKHIVMHGESSTIHSRSLPRLSIPVHELFE